MQNSSQIILDSSRVVSQVKKFRQQNKKIVLTQGSFDMVHIGHARYCAKAKSYGDVLIVGVDSDEKVKKRKGADRPIVPQDERLEMLTHLSSVDLVVLKHLHDPKWQLIKMIAPDVLVATRDNYTNEQLQDLKQYCKKVIVLEPMATTSTSAKLRRMQIGAADKISNKLSEKLSKAIDEILTEMRG